MPSPIRIIGKPKGLGRTTSSYVKRHQKNKTNTLLHENLLIEKNDQPILIDDQADNIDNASCTNKSDSIAMSVRNEKQAETTDDTTTSPIILKKTRGRGRPRGRTQTADPEIVRNWSQILEQDLVFSSFICDKHFDEEYILRKDVINIPGQEPYVSERKKITLKPGAIPTLYKNINETSPLINVPVDETVNEIIVDLIDERQFIESQDLVEVNEQISVDLQIDNYVVEANNIVQNECIDSELSELNTQFSIYELVRNLETYKLPQKWSWVEDHLDSPAVILCYLDYKSYDVKFRVKVDKALNITVTNAKSNQSVKSDFIISNIKEFWKFLEILEISQICSGSGFDDQKSSEACTFFLTVDEQYKKQAGIYRCGECRQLRKKLRNQLYRPKIDADDQNKKLKLELNNVKKKCTRLINKSVRLKETIEEEKKKCANASESAVENEILLMPPIQQETVRACFAAAKVKNSKQRRHFTS
ncbi:uncharacterized protein LOC130664276 [Microplitis mediator]|uniref:uncharacterized protein LOC130664276 n=1 Tax=Microplitis mediator TaxID=375433 RepID=UPI0025563482|nr:uncharacterized protein LOC130664276 [Microplitis mediator]